MGQECSRCFLTTRFPGVQIPETEPCSHCGADTIRRSMRDHIRGGLEDLQRLVEPYRARSAPGPQAATGTYEAVVGVSGGLDSSYVLYIAARLLGLKTLAVHYDHGFNRTESQENLRRLCRSLGVDLRTVRSEGAHDREYIRRMVLALRPLGVYWGLCLFCGPAISAVVYREAVRERIPLLLTSQNPYEGTLYLTHAFRRRWLLRALVRAGVHYWPACAWHIGHALRHLRLLQRELRWDPRRPIHLTRVEPPPGIRHLTVSRWVPWAVDEMVSTLERDCDWHPPDPSLPMRFDCLIEEGFVNETYLRAVGTTVHGIIASNLVYGGIRTKEELRDAVASFEARVPERTAALLERLGVSPR